MVYRIKCLIIIHFYDSIYSIHTKTEFVQNCVANNVHQLMNQSLINVTTGHQSGFNEIVMDIARILMNSCRVWYFTDIWYTSLIFGFSFHMLSYKIQIIFFLCWMFQHDYKYWHLKTNLPNHISNIGKSANCFH